MASFDMGEAWKQVVAMFKGNREILLTVGGLFFFLPTLAFSLYAGLPPEPTPGATPQQFFPMFMEYYRQVAPALFIASIISMIGNLALWRLLLAPGGTSLGGALGTAAALFLSYLAASFLSGIALMIGFLLLIIPGLYLAGRLSLIGPVMAANDVKNPITAIQDSWNYTRNNGWAILGFMIVVGLVGGVAMMISGAIFGALFALILPASVANVANQVVQAFLSAGLSLIMLLVVTSIYRQLGPTKNQETFS